MLLRVLTAGETPHSGVVSQELRQLSQLSEGESEERREDEARLSLRRSEGSEESSALELPRR